MAKKLWEFLFRADMLISLWGVISANRTAISVSATISAMFGGEAWREELPPSIIGLIIVAVFAICLFLAHQYKELKAKLILIACSLGLPDFYLARRLLLELRD